MQFYLNGYQPGDPDILAAAPMAENRSSILPDAVDVLIVGSGPAGTLLAAQLSTFPGIITRLVERRDGPLKKIPRSIVSIHRTRYSGLGCSVHISRRCNRDCKCSFRFACSKVVNPANVVNFHSFNARVYGAGRKSSL